MRTILIVLVSSVLALSFVEDCFGAFDTSYKLLENARTADLTACSFENELYIDFCLAEANSSFNQGVNNALHAFDCCAYGC